MRRLTVLLTLVATSFAVAVAAAEGPVVYMPHSKSGPVPVAVWLHGYRSFPGFIAEEHDYFQGVADRAGIAIVGVPGTKTLADGSLQWAEDPAADHTHIQEILGKLPQRNRLNLRRVILFGFSQGALVAGALASLYPELYRGAVIMSPGGFQPPSVAQKPNKAIAGQTYYVVCGANEHPMNVQNTRFLADALRRVGARVTETEYPGVSRHTRPPDFKERFPEWAATILKMRLPSGAGGRR
jgi:predicted esterase